jgi:hypothetical protein
VSANSRWTVVSTFTGLHTFVSLVPLAVFSALYNALEYAAFVQQYDAENFPHWLTYVIEVDLLND